MNEILDRLRECLNAYPDPSRHGYGEAMDLDAIARPTRELLRLCADDTRRSVPRSLVIIEAASIAEAVRRMRERRGE